MPRELFGIAILAIIALTLASGWRRQPDKGNYKVAPSAFPRFHLIKGQADAEASLDVADSEHHALGRLVLDDGRVFGPKDGSLYPLLTHDFYLIDPRWDFGTFGGFRDSQSSDADPFAVGLRISPVRLLYGTTAPDLVLAKDWAGAGASFYLPAQLVGRTCSHIGIGAWYGIPFSSQDDHVDAAWTFGLSFSTR